MTNRFDLDALGRGAVTIALGLAIIYAACRWLGWWPVVAILGITVGAGAIDLLWTMSRLPLTWRPW